jgi:drug/metabolite transporter (DMT)-like permease
MTIGLPSWLAFTTVALLFWGGTGVTQKLSTNAISSRLSFLWYAFGIFAVSGVFAISTKINWHVNALDSILAILGGTLNGLGTFTSFKALEAGGKASVVIALISLYPLLTVVAAVALLHERLSALQWVGVAAAVLAAILLSVEPTVAVPTAKS